MPRGEELAQIGADLGEREVAHGAGKLGELFARDAARKTVLIRPHEKCELVLREGRALVADALDALIDVRRVQQPVPKHLQDLGGVPERNAVGTPLRDPL